MTVRPQLASIATTVVVSCAALLPLSGIFDGVGWWFRLIIAVLLAAGVTTAVETTYPERTFPVLAIATAAGATLWALIVVHGSEFASSPFGATVWSRVGDGLFSGWSELLSVGEPTADLAAAETFLGLLVWASVAASLHVAARWRSPLGVIVLSASMLAITTAAALNAVSSGAFFGGVVGAACLFAVASLGRSEADQWRAGRLAALAAVIGAAGLVGAGLVVIAGPLLPEPVDPRQNRETTADIINVPDLLSEFGARSDDQAIAFETTRLLGEPDSALRFRLQTFGTHDGQRFLPIAEYVEAARLTEPGGIPVGEQFAVEIQLRSLDQPFLPLLDRTIQTDITNAGWDLDTQTAIHQNRPTRYQVTGAAIEPNDLDATDVLVAGIDPIYRELPNELPSAIQSAALTAVAGATNDRAAVDAIATSVAQLRNDPTVASGHSLGRLETDLAEQRSISLEQRAAIETLMLRAAGIPARPVVGYVSTGGPLSGSALSVWVEVPFEGVGWIPTTPAAVTFAPITAETAPTTTVPRTDDVAAQAQPRELGPGTETLDNEREPFRLSLTDVGLIATVLVALAILGVAATRIGRRQRRRTAASHDDRTLGAWAELIDRLREAGVLLGRATTVRDVVESAVALDPATRPAAESLASHAAAVFHGPQPASASQSAHAWEDLKTIEGVLQVRQGRRFQLQRVFDPRALRHPAPTPPPNRDGGRVRSRA